MSRSLISSQTHSCHNLYLPCDVAGEGFLQKPQASSSTLLPEVTSGDHEPLYSKLKRQVIPRLSVGTSDDITYQSLVAFGDIVLDC